MHIYFLSAFVVYFAVLLLIGFLSHRKQTTSIDFIMGNRSLNFWLVALSAHASDMSAWLFMAFPMSIFLLGLPRLWIAFGLLVGMYLNWSLVAHRLRAMTEANHCYTLPSFFECHFQDRSGTLRRLSACVMTIFLTHYLSSGFIAIGNLLESLFGIDYHLGLSIAVTVMVLYTFIGGFTTVAYIDLFQALFLLVGILVVPWMAYQHIEGISQIVSTAQKASIPLRLIDGELSSVLTMFSLALGWGLGYFGMPHIITKFMGLKNPSEMNKAKWLGMSWQLVTLSAAALVGLVGIAYFPQGLDNAEMIFVEMVKGLFHPFFGGLILCGILAANLSTMDSQILVCGSMLSEDLYKPMHRFPPSDQKVLLVSRMSVVVIAVVALLLAFNRSATILDTVLYSWSGLGSAIGPVVLTALYSKRANRHGAIAGIVVGATVVMFWPSLNRALFTYELLPMIPAFFLSLASIFLVSRLFPEQRTPARTDR